MNKLYIVLAFILGSIASSSGWYYYVHKYKVDDKTLFDTIISVEKARTELVFLEDKKLEITNSIKDREEKLKMLDRYLMVRHLEFLALYQTKTKSRKNAS